MEKHLSIISPQTNAGNPEIDTLNILNQWNCPSFRGAQRPWNERLVPGPVSPISPGIKLSIHRWKMNRMDCPQLIAPEVTGYTISVLSGLVDESHIRVPV